jgi:hypothetical protein
VRSSIGRKLDRAWRSSLDRGVRSSLIAALPAAAFVFFFLVDHVRRFGGLYLASDDSYIYLGYVKRTMEAPRELFSYNPGEHSAGTTGLLYYYALVVVSHVVRVVTFPWPLHFTLRLSSYVLSGSLTVIASLLYWGTWRRLDPESERAPTFTFAIATALFFANARFIWGLFAGLENPLSATLVLALAHAFAHRVRSWWTGLLAALLAATRPDLGSVVWVVPFACAALADRAPRRRAFVESAVVLVAGVLVLVAPCRLITGRWFPSALDTRIRVDAVRDPTLVFSNIADALRVTTLTKTDWQVGALLVLAAAVMVSARRRRAHPALFTSGAIVFVFFARAIFRVEQLNIEDRYVSYFWPLLALGAGVLAAPVLRRACARHPSSAVVTAGLVAVLAVVVPVREGLRRLARDVTEMNQIVVAASLFMQRELPRGARVAMEPAGAIRVFTDFYLVDGFGLTTTHLLRSSSWDEMIEKTRVEYVFDYPFRLPQLEDPARFEAIEHWRPDPPVHVLAPIGLYRCK